MQHADLIAGIKRITDALAESGLRKALAPSENQNPEELLDALRRYAAVATSFTPGEVTVADLLGLGDLESSTVWAKLLGVPGARAHYYDRVGFVTHHLPRFVDLLEEARAEDTDAELLHVRVKPDGSRGLGGPRFVTIVNSLSTLYRSCAAVHGLGVDDLRLVTCESSDEVALSFEGVSAAVVYVKELLTASFRWLAVYREHELVERIQLARDGLPTIRTIRALHAGGGINRPEAEKLENEIVAALLAFFDSGALIPEIDADLAKNAREIVPTPRPPPAASSVPDFELVAREIEQIPESMAEGDIALADAFEMEVPRPHDSVIDLTDEPLETVDEDSTAGEDQP
jgi:hypothetical protein